MIRYRYSAKILDDVNGWGPANDELPNEIEAFSQSRKPLCFSKLWRVNGWEKENWERIEALKSEQNAPFCSSKI
jgi:hypothetical protein